MPKLKYPAQHKSVFQHRLFLPGVLGVSVVTIFLVATNLDLSIFAAKGGNPTPTPFASIAPAPTNGNLLTNASFESYGGKLKTPTYWIQHYEQPNTLAQTVCNDFYSGKCSYFVDGKKSNAIKQYIAYQAPAGSTIKVAGWGKGQNVSNNTNPDTGSFWVQTWIHYTDGSIEYGLHADFDNGTHPYQYKEASFTVPKAVEGLTYFVKFTKSGYAWFDDVSLFVAMP